MLIVTFSYYKNCRILRICFILDKYKIVKILKWYVKQMNLIFRYWRVYKLLLQLSEFENISWLKHELM